MLRKLMLMTGAVAAACVPTVLLIPLAAGWVQPQLSRLAILERAHADGESAGTDQVKLVSAADLAAAFPENPPPSGNVALVVGLALATSVIGRSRRRMPPAVIPAGEGAG